MFFDAQAALAEILKSEPPPAIRAIPAIPTPVLPPNSRNSRNSRGVPTEMENRVARPFPEISNAAVISTGPQSIRHGRDMNGNPKTWTGGAVTLAAWRNLSDWDRHGSTGKVWNGLTRAWEPRILWVAISLPCQWPHARSVPN